LLSSGVRHDQYVPSQARLPALTVWRVTVASLAVGGLALALAAPAYASSTAPVARAGPPAATPISVNTLNWSGSAGFGSRRPAWYQDASGVIAPRLPAVLADSFVSLEVITYRR
jgi:hypothetical protein